MHYFPMFADTRKRHAILCGSGAHARDKLARLAPFALSVKVICLRPWQESLPDGVEFIQKRFEQEDLQPETLFVIACEEEEEDQRIACICKETGVPVNVVDRPQLCDFIFPSMIVTRHLCIGICTDGLSPAAGVTLRERIAHMLPSDPDDIIEELNMLRTRLRAAGVAPEKIRRLLLDAAEQAL